MCENVSKLREDTKKNMVTNFVIYKISPGGDFKMSLKTLSQVDEDLELFVLHLCEAMAGLWPELPVKLQKLVDGHAGVEIFQGFGEGYHS